MANMDSAELEQAMAADERRYAEQQSRTVYAAIPTTHISEARLEEMENATGTQWRFQGNLSQRPGNPGYGRIWCQWFTTAATREDAERIATWCREQQIDGIAWVAQVGRDHFPTLGRTES